MAFRRLFGLWAASISTLGLAAAHGGAHQKPLEVDPNAPWATRHMAEEHHIDNFDAGAFFQLHDFDDDGHWDESEILKTYGMDDPSAKDVPQDKKDNIVREVMRLIDTSGSGLIEKDEWMAFSNAGKELPDFGLGPGHHWDMEMEYEIHHWEKYHDENTKEEDLIHPEDIEHFRKHDELEDEAERVAALDKMSIVVDNIPRKFRRDG